MSRLTLLPALDTDLLARCLQVRRAVFVLEKGVPESLEVDDSDHLGTSCLHFLIQVDGADAGALRCQSDGSSAVRIQRLCMKARYRGGGWGKAALAEVERHCLANGADRIVLDAKFDVCGFYEACGYRRVSSVFLEANVPHVRMEKAFTI